MTTEAQLVVGSAALVVVFFYWSLMRASARGERAARQRKRELNDSLINRRLSR